VAEKTPDSNVHPPVSNDETGYLVNPTMDLTELADILISAFAALHSEKAEADHE